jgi:NTP pyrophosphatase (non-canonical NTP hydrolase)
MTDDNERLRLADLRSANIARQKEWDAGNQLSLAYRGNELAGEVGEACNVIKKLERERLGIAGSRDTVAHLAEELADVIICTDLIAMQAGIDLDAAVVAKFNASSEKVGLKTRLTAGGRAASVKAGEVVVVKALEWRDHRPDSFPEPAWSAQTPFGFYNIEEVSASDSPAYVVRLHAHHFIADKDSLDAAKAAAQADYEARIRSALVVEPVKGEPVGYISPATLEALNDPNGSGPVVAAAGYDTLIPIYAATPDTSSSVGLREALGWLLDAIKSEVKFTDTTPLLKRRFEAAERALAANQSDGGVEGHAAKGGTSGSLRHSTTRSEEVGNASSPAQGQAGIAGIKPGPSDTSPAPQAVEAVSVDDRERDYIRHGLREEDLP